jgi:hypothetical protein
MTSGKMEEAKPQSAGKIVTSIFFIIASSFGELNLSATLLSRCAVCGTSEKRCKGRENIKECLMFLKCLFK